MLWTPICSDLSIVIFPFALSIAQNFLSRLLRLLHSLLCSSIFRPVAWVRWGPYAKLWGGPKLYYRVLWNVIIGGPWPKIGGPSHPNDSALQFHSAGEHLSANTGGRHRRAARRLIDTHGACGRRRRRALSQRRRRLLYFTLHSARTLHFALFSAPTYSFNTNSSISPIASFYLCVLLLFYICCNVCTVQRRRPARRTT